MADLSHEEQVAALFAADKLKKLEQKLYKKTAKIFKEGTAAKITKKQIADQNREAKAQKKVEIEKANKARAKESATKATKTYKTTVSNQLKVANVKLKAADKNLTVRIKNLGVASKGVQISTTKGPVFGTPTRGNTGARKEITITFSGVKNRSKALVIVQGKSPLPNAPKVGGALERYLDSVAQAELKRVTKSLLKSAKNYYAAGTLNESNIRRRKPELTSSASTLASQSSSTLVSAMRNIKQEKIDSAGVILDFTHGLTSVIKRHQNHYEEYLKGLDGAMKSGFNLHGQSTSNKVSVSVLGQAVTAYGEFRKLAQTTVEQKKIINANTMWKHTGKLSSAFSLSVARQLKEHKPTDFYDTKSVKETVDSLTVQLSVPQWKGTSSAPLRNFMTRIIPEAYAQGMGHGGAGSTSSWVENRAASMRKAGEAKAKKVSEVLKAREHAAKVSEYKPTKFGYARGGAKSSVPPTPKTKVAHVVAPAVSKKVDVTREHIMDYWLNRNKGK